MLLVTPIQEAALIHVFEGGQVEADLPVLHTLYRTMVERRDMRARLDEASRKAGRMRR